MAITKPTLLIPVEPQVRELEPKLLLAGVAAKLWIPLMIQALLLNPGFHRCI
jgi:hypothetical protein